MMFASLVVFEELFNHRLTETQRTHREKLFSVVPSLCVLCVSVTLWFGDFRNCG